MDESTRQSLKWAEKELGEHIIQTRPLKGGTSSLLHQLTTTSGRAVVLREYNNQEWLTEDPTVVYREALNLKEAKHLTIPTPAFIAVDDKGETAGRPSILMSKVDGQVDLNPKDRTDWLRQLAQMLVTIHSLNKPTITHQYFSYNNDITKPKANWSSVPKNWQRLITYLNETKTPDYEPVFIHRDFHPTNVLWENNQVSAVVDWPNACIGPREMDIAHCRVNLAQMYGQSVADAFLTYYLDQSELTTYDNYWDLEALKNIFQEETPEVYKGWEVFGLNQLTSTTIVKRLDTFLIEALKQETFKDN